MTTTLTHFASGKITDSLAAIYTAPSAAGTVVSDIGKVVFTNTGTTKQEVSVYRDDGTQRLVETFTIAGGVGKSYTVNTLIGAKLNEGDSILAVTETNEQVNYQIDGRTAS